MKKALFTALIATFIGLFSTQAFACGSCQNGGQCSCQQSTAKSCGCKGGSCKAGE